MAVAKRGRRAYKNFGLILRKGAREVSNKLIVVERVVQEIPVID